MIGPCCKGPFMNKMLLIAFFTFCVLTLVCETAVAQNLIVNTLAGDNDGSCDAGGTGPNDDCSLLEALDVANADGDSAVIGNDENAVAPSMSWLDRVEPRLSKALKIMDTHHEQPLTVDEVSAQLHLSTRTLELLMQRHLGTSPGAYYLRSRLQAARRLVLDT